MAIEIVDLLIENGGSFHSYVSLPEGNWMIWGTMDGLFHGKSQSKIDDLPIYMMM